MCATPEVQYPSRHLSVDLHVVQALRERGGASMRLINKMLASGLWISLMAMLGVTGAQADVSKDYALETWDNSKCRVFAYVDRVRQGDFTGDGRKDVAILWTCSTGAGAAQVRVVSYWIDGDPIRQKRVELPVSTGGKLKIKNGQVIVIAGGYSSYRVPLCCPDLEVRLTYKWNGKKLKLVKQVSKPKSR